MPTVSPRWTIIDDVSQAVGQSGVGGGGPQLVFPGGSMVWTEQTPAEDTLERECPHDVVGLRTHDGTMWSACGYAEYYCGRGPCWPRSYRTTGAVGS